MGYYEQLPTKVILYLMMADSLKNSLDGIDSNDKLAEILRDRIVILIAKAQEIIDSLDLNGEIIPTDARKGNE